MAWVDMLLNFGIGNVEKAVSDIDNLRSSIVKLTAEGKTNVAKINQEFKQWARSSQVQAEGSRTAMNALTQLGNKAKTATTPAEKVLYQQMDAVGRKMQSFSVTGAQTSAAYEDMANTVAGTATTITNQGIAMGLTGEVQDKATTSLIEYESHLRSTAASIREVEENTRTNVVAQEHNIAVTKKSQTGQQTMAKYGNTMNKILIAQQSAFHGVMLGTAALNGNIVGLAFSMIFLRFSLIHIVGPIAAMVAIFGLVWRRIGEARKRVDDLVKASMGLGLVGSNLEITTNRAVALKEAFEITKVPVSELSKVMEYFTRIGVEPSGEAIANVVGIAKEAGVPIDEFASAMADLSRDMIRAWVEGKTDYTDYVKTLIRLTPPAKGSAEELTAAYFNLVGQVMSLTDPTEKLNRLMAGTIEIMGKEAVATARSAKEQDARTLAVKEGIRLAEIQKKYAKELEALGLPPTLPFFPTTPAFRAYEILGPGTPAGLPKKGGLLDWLKSWIPGWQAGGVVTRPTLGLLGEGGPEAIVPLSRARGMGFINIDLRGAYILSDRIPQELADRIAERIRTTTWSGASYR